MLNGDEVKALPDKHRKIVPSDPMSMMAWLYRNVAPDSNPLTRGVKFLGAIGETMSAKYKEGAKRVLETTVQMASRLGTSPEVQNSLQYLGEPWDGKGSVMGVRGQFIPIGSRVVSVAQVAYIIYAADGPQAAQEMVLQRRGKGFDPSVVDAYMELSKDPAFLEALKQDSLLESVWAMEPQTEYSHIPESRLDDVATSFAEFIDMKSPFTASHSRGVAVVAETLAKKMGLPASEVSLTKRAGLLHDLGKVSVSNSILDKKGKLSEPEWERMRLHPYYTERILTKVEALRPLAPIAGAHHEWMNGGGYFRQLSQGQLSKPAQIIAIADMFHALSEERPYRAALETEQILQIMEKEAGNHLSPECFAALKTML